mgnify:CR=1 FL=1
MNEQELEQHLNEKGLNAPRLSPEFINKTIKWAQYYVFPETTLTVCCLTLNNGFNVTGTSATASIEYFDKEVGQDIAFKNARDKVWELECYLLKEKLSKR